MGQYFVYRHLIPNGIPFYIGIGKKSKEFTTIKTEYTRAYDTRRNKFWTNHVSKYGLEVEILYESDSHEEIIQKEKEFITLYGRRDLDLGPLVNLTNGGDESPMLGKKHTDDSLKKMSIKTKGRIRPESERQRISLSTKGKKLSKETKEKISIAKKGKPTNKTPYHLIEFNKKLKGVPKSEEHKKKIGDAHRGKIMSLESREKMRQSHLGVKIPQEVLIKRSQSLKGRIISAEHRKKIGDAKRGVSLSDIHKQNLKKAWIKRKANGG